MVSKVEHYNSEVLNQACNQILPNQAHRQAQQGYLNQQPQQQVPMYQRAYVTNTNQIIEDVVTNPFAYDGVELEPNSPEYESINNKLVGTANPKTFIAPVIIPPIADLGYWKATNLVTHSSVNDSTNLDVFQSGYEVTNFCENDKCYPRKPYSYMKVAQENPEKDVNYNQKFHKKYMDHQLKTNQANQTHQMPMRNQPPSTSSTTSMENFTFADDTYGVGADNIGYVDRSCGYDPNQFVDSGLPVNLASGPCQKAGSMYDFNKNLFTQTIQPGIYSVNQVNEPINSNMGISYNQQFEPLTYSVNNDGLTFTEHNPLTRPVGAPNLLDNSINDVIEPMTQANVYDPRFSGYGTSYRAYTDENVGQTRYFYDDVDSVRMPNYVIRSKIDFADFADTYGAMKSQKGDENTTNIRALANQKFLDDAMLFRTGMQERLMRKTNAEAWQQRSKPINKGNQRMLGGMR